MKLTNMLIVKWIGSCLRLSMLQWRLRLLETVLPRSLKSLAVPIIDRVCLVKSFLGFGSIFYRIHLVALNEGKHIFTVSSY